ncbi:hypothetical protein [Candidatus Korarchaeum cryptofilum]|uniref:hypothetical protein n=1 Tax=Candidatus Korarchaeum cryptofilum TaxID=498846 RepID=UPI0011D16D37|nr:hypothetical protein [Candidatus Korarchaeum cryptofilum]
MRARDTIIVGGGASGFTAALAARVLYKDKYILLLKEEDKTLIPCDDTFLSQSDCHPRRNYM